MDIEQLPEPILFHPLEHHLQHIRHFINSSGNYTVATLRSLLQTIGTSQLDLYTGDLSPFQIAQEIILQLDAKNILAPAPYRNFLTSAGSDFSILTLSDQTNWVLRLGLQEKRHVHLHPARYAKNTIRIKATALKTSIASLIYQKKEQTALDLLLVNQVRKEWLGLSPVKELVNGVGVMLLIDLLRGR